MTRRLLYFAAVAYLAVALCQIPASVGGIHQLTGLWWPLCALGALIVGSVPILGTALAIEGARTWGWDSAGCYAFFLGVPLFFVALSALQAAAERLARRLSRP